MITGYRDDFNRTVSGGFGTATSGQTYAVTASAAQYSVSGGVASILPTAVGDRLAYVDRLTSDIDITGQVALTAIPATNLMTVGFVFKRSSNTEYYSATMMVAAGGAVSLRFSKVTGGGLSTILTVPTGITYVANTFYNLRVAAYWSSDFQANVLRSKLWAVGAAEPGGWMAATTDGAQTQYSAGSTAGLFARDEATVSGAVTAKIQNVAARTYGLPVPASTDTMCADPAIAYPKQTALESMADAIDVVSATFDPLADLAALFPRVRVSARSFTLTTNGPQTPSWNTVEFNIGTETNLGYSNGLRLPAGVWLVTFEVQMAPAAVDDFGQIAVFGGSSTLYGDSSMRMSTAQNNLDSQGGSAHASTLVYSTDPENFVTANGNIAPESAANYTINYAALTAFKISDYFA